MSACRRRHRMPFGAEVIEDGGVRFRLWAPGAQRLELCLVGDGATTEMLPMEVEEDGWYGLTTDRAGAGTLYRFRVDGAMQVPDPASRFQPQDVHGPSEVVDPLGWEWSDCAWRGRPWEEAVIYELHVGSFTPAGDFAGVERKLDYLCELGVTALELMPVADFPGARNWGYDGVGLYAPDSVYGRPESLKALVAAAHAREMMVLLDVVYNHFGPEGNYLSIYAPPFFDPRRQTPWGAAINFDGEASRWVRQFFIENALYWLREFNFDGLRFDAVHAISDDSARHILFELADRVRDQTEASRHVHLVLENDDNAARYLRRDPEQRQRWYAAQWNDDIHHAFHVALTGEDSGYYRDYTDPARHLARCLTQGFAYQGEPSPYRNDQPRGEASADLPASAFVAFTQNHDQIGNRAFGERLEALAPTAAVRAAQALLLLAPSPPLLFMGQEWCSRKPFLFFCDFGAELAESVVSGRRAEFAGFPQFSDPAAREKIPDPMAEATFRQVVLDWESVDDPPHADCLALTRELLALRKRELLPRMSAAGVFGEGYHLLGERAFAADWRLPTGERLRVMANLGETPFADVSPASGRCFYASHALQEKTLPPWSVFWYLDEGPPR